MLRPPGPGSSRRSRAYPGRRGRLGSSRSGARARPASPRPRRQAVPGRRSPSALAQRRLPLSPPPPPLPGRPFIPAAVPRRALPSSLTTRPGARPRRRGAGGRRAEQRPAPAPSPSPAVASLGAGRPGGPGAGQSLLCAWRGTALGGGGVGGCHSAQLAATARYASGPLRGQPSPARPSAPPAAPPSPAQTGFGQPQGSVRPPPAPDWDFPTV